jgi:hypothetical protein
MKNKMAYLVILVAAGVILSHPEDKVQDRHECPDRIGVSAKHDVAETNVVVRGNVAGSDPSERRLKLYEVHNEAY